MDKSGFTRDVGFGGERGSITPIIALLIGFSFLLAASVAGLGVVLQKRSQAQAAADAVALAIAADGLTSGQRVAEANGAEIVAVVDQPDGRSGTVRVVVTVDGISASAAAAEVPISEGKPWRPS